MTQIPIPFSQNVSRETLEKIDLYIDLLNLWNRRINLIGKNDLPKLKERHILDGLFLGQYLSSHTESVENRIVDIGSGNGIPALQAAIITKRPFVLIESDIRKCAFLRECVTKLEINCTVAQTRAENFHFMATDIITARAFASLRDILSLLTIHEHKPHRLLLQKGAKAAEEIAEAKSAYGFTYSSVNYTEEKTLLDITSYMRLT